MGRTIPSFRIALAMEKEEWKPFRNALDKKDRKKFDEMFDIPRNYISACSYSVQYVRLHPILMSILLYRYKQLTECISEVEQIEAKMEGLLLPPQPQRQQQQQKTQEVATTTTLDSFISINKSLET